MPLHGADVSPLARRGIVPTGLHPAARCSSHLRDMPGVSHLLVPWMRVAGRSTFRKIGCADSGRRALRRSESEYLVAGSSPCAAAAVNVIDVMTAASRANSRWSDARSTCHSALGNDWPADQLPELAPSIPIPASSAPPPGGQRSRPRAPIAAAVCAPRARPRATTSVFDGPSRAQREIAKHAAPTNHRRACNCTWR